MNTTPALPTFSSPDFGLSHPLSARSIFWRARYLRQSDFLHHVPFLFWLIEVGGAVSFVTLGLRDGVAHFAACQALDKLQPDAKCYGVDAWTELEGCVPGDLATYNSEMYDEISELITGAPATVARQFDEESVDILLIDLGDAPGVIETLLQDWLPRLSERSVVLIHGVRDERFTGEAGRTVLARMGGRSPLFHLHGGSGLAVLLTGSEQDERLRKLASLKRGEPGFTEMQHVFRRLGDAHCFECLSRIADGRLREAEDGLAAAKAERARLAEELQVQSSAYDARNRQMAEMQSRNHDLAVQAKETEGALAQIGKKHEQALTELEMLRGHVAELEKHKQEAEALAEARARELEALNQAIAQQHQERERENERFAADRATRFAEIAALTQELERLEQEKSATHSRMVEAEQQSKACRNKFEAIVNSTSWRMTGPARKTIEKWRSLK